MEREKKKKLVIAVVVLLLLVIVVGGTFAWLRIGYTASSTNKIKAGMLDLRIDESPTLTENVRLEREIPKSYRQGLLNQPYRFTIQNYSGMATDYEISLVSEYTGSDESATKIPDNYIRYLLVKNDEEMLPSNSKLLSTGRTIESETIQGGTKTNPTEIPYTLYVWIDSMAGEGTNGSDIMNMIFNAKITITAEQHHAPVAWIPTFGAGTTFQPIYFASAIPTTSDVTRPTDDVFIGMDASGNKGVCINRGGATHCFQSGVSTASYEQTHLQQVFSDVGSFDESTGLGCKYVDSSQWGCNASDFGCNVYDNGMVIFLDYSANVYCVVTDGVYGSCHVLTS